MRKSINMNLTLIAVLFGASLLLAGCGDLNSPDTGGSSSGGSSIGGSGGGNSPAGLPGASYRQTPQEITFDGCPPEGDGGDPILNQNKNRVDEGNYQPTSFSAIAQLTWPSETEKTSRDNWSSSAQAAIAQAEGLPVAVEGYLALARKEGPESTNCHSTTDEDFHIWLIDHPGGSADRNGSIVVEATPRVRANHPGWTVSRLLGLAQNGTKVRISGWLMFDQDHPEQLNDTRGTLWEIHPIMRIDVQTGNGWTALDNY
ncbi:MAG TPA: hypothetical protein VKQ72_05760 [Aggregatilineales bacterium]|nr:hypothetical protein [Aggregatilineales bacterium]